MGWLAIVLRSASSGCPGHAQLPPEAAIPARAFPGGYLLTLNRYFISAPPPVTPLRSNLTDFPLSSAMCEDNLRHEVPS